MSAQERLDRYGDRTGAGSPMQTLMRDASAFYAAMPILINLVLSEAGGRGVQEHDRVVNLANRDNVPFEDFVGRFIDTADLVAGLALTTGKQRVLIAETLREIHRHVEGTLDNGDRYHAWNRDLWAWSWAGIIMPVLQAYEQLHGPQSPEFLEDAYIGALQLGDMIGIRGLPDTYAGGLEYWKNQWLPLAVAPGTGKFLLSLAYDVPLPAGASWIPKPVWNATLWPVRNLMRTSAFLLLEPQIQHLLGMRATRTQQLSIHMHRMIWRTAPRTLFRNLFGLFMDIRLRHGNNSWDRHYSPQALADYHQQVKDARGQGRPQPPRPSKRH